MQDSWHFLRQRGEKIDDHGCSKIRDLLVEKTRTSSRYPFTRKTTLCRARGKIAWQISNTAFKVVSFCLVLSVFTRINLLKDSFFFQIFFFEKVRVQDR